MEETTLQIEIAFESEEQKDTLIAQLSAIGFEAFEELENSLCAYIPFASFSEDALIAVLQGQVFKQQKIEKQNWNQLWESNFEPVQVDDFVGIRASFHPPFTGVEHEIVITPKMSFGTGHHATTFLVMQAMKQLNWDGKTVFDFGSGTGILAILAEKLGAKNILAIDNDDWCIENANENIEINLCSKIQVQKADTAALQTQRDIILANINKHIILANMKDLNNALAKDGKILLSGLLIEDESDILIEAEKQGWKHQFTNCKNGWIVCQFTKA